MTRIFKNSPISLGTQLSIGVAVMTLTLLGQQERTNLDVATERAKNEALLRLQVEADQYAEKVWDLESRVTSHIKDQTRKETIFERIPEALAYRSYRVDERGTVRDEAFFSNPKSPEAGKPENFIPEISYIRIAQEGKAVGETEVRIIANAESESLLLFSSREKKISTGRNKKTTADQTLVQFVYAKPTRLKSESTHSEAEVYEHLGKSAAPNAFVELDPDKKPKNIIATSHQGGAFAVRLKNSWKNVNKALKAEQKKSWIRIGTGTLIAFVLMMLFSRVVLKKVTEEVAKKTILEQELKIASAVQESLFPAGVFENNDCQIYGKYLSAAICGGDWWNHFTIDRKLCFIVADATGHGVSSALITASARGAFSVIQKIAESDPTFPLSPGLMMDMANRVVYDSAKTKVMMTAFIGVIDLDEKKLIYANASHNPPWLFRNVSNKGQTESLVPEGLRLGEVESPPQYAEFEIALHTGDTIVFYSDGYLENQNSKGEIYGKKRARRKIEENLATHPKELVDQLILDFKAFNGEKPLDDDATIAAIRILNPSTEASV